MSQISIVFVSSVTDPLRASAAPQSICAVVSREMLVSATIWPMISDDVLRVAELPTR